MTNWTTPKTDWTSVDGVTDADFIRIESNTQHLKEQVNISLDGTPTIYIPQLTAPWLAFSSFRVPKYLKTANGIVFIKGAVKSGSLGASFPIFTLPTGFRPIDTEEFIVPASGSAAETARLVVASDGKVYVDQVSNATSGLNYVSLSISFHTAM